MNREYFENLDEKAEGLDLNTLELVIPEGFRKKLNSIEEFQLLNDQLLCYGLQLGSYIMGSHKIVQANKGSQHIEKNLQISKRLKEYLKKFNNSKKD